MLTIKFSRKGRKKQPFYRIIVLEKAKDPRGNFLEDLGFRNPLSKETVLKKERIKYWLSQGAQPTGSVRNLLISEGIMEGEKVKVTKVNQKKFQKKQEEAKASKDQEEKKESLKKEEGQEEKEEKVESSEEKTEEKVEEKKA
ncbi:30S ribosomal protein S16 [Patescibacteria group bacterium]|nr:30S ribosomal protein S16 [Patescibacteria group bacterium]